MDFESIYSRKCPPCLNGYGKYLRGAVREDNSVPPSTLNLRAASKWLQVGLLPPRVWTTFPAAGMRSEIVRFRREERCPAYRYAFSMDPAPMGQIRFVVSPPPRITEEVLQFTYMSGMERTPWLCEVERDGDELVIERDVSDSGCVTMPWHVEGHGTLALSTGTLIERWEPYHLPLELARGTINLLRSQIYDWQAIGVTVPDEVRRLLKTALAKFSHAVTEPLDDQGRAAEESIRAALDAGQLLAAAYTDQAIASRRRATGRLPSLLAGELAHAGMEEATARMFLAAFNVAWVPLYWRDVEASEGEFDWADCDRRLDWCRAQGLRTCVGPLVQFDDRGLPDWVYLWDDDFESMLTAAGQFVEAAVKRYRGKVDLWHCASKANTSHSLHFSDEERLRLVAWIVCRVKELDPERPHVVGVDQPWGEYLGRKASDLSPLHFADALIRARIDMRAILLEMNFGCFAGGTLPRSELDLNRHLDTWAMLGLPLVIAMNLPSGDGLDPKARQKLAAPAGSWSPGPAAGLGRSLCAAVARQAGRSRDHLEPIRRLPTARVSSRRSDHAARPGQARAPHVGRAASSADQSPPAAVTFGLRRLVTAFSKRS